MARIPINAGLLVLCATTALSASDIEVQVRAARGGTQGLTRVNIQLLRNGLTVDEHLVGANGRYEFRNLAIGSYAVRAHADGYSDEEVSVIAMRANSRDVVQIDLHPIKASKEEAADTISVAKYQIPREAKREYDRGLQERKRGNCAEAIGHLEKALSTFEKYGEAFNELGNCYNFMGEFARAEQSFEKAVEYTDTIYPAMNLADLYAAQKRFGDAQDLLRQSMSRYPAEGDLDFAMARIQFDQGRIVEAEQAALEAHMKVHRFADVHLLLAKIYLAMKKYPALVSQLHLYLDENPKGPMADRVRQNLKELQEPAGK